MYILTQEELDALQKQQEATLKLSKDKLQELCTQIADTMPIKYWGRQDAEPWRCILTVKKEWEGDFDEWYCDECPVRSICPNTSKQYSQ